MSSSTARSASALVLMDFHRTVVDSLGEGGNLATDRAAEALNECRRRHIPIFHVVPHSRPGYTELGTGEPFDSIRRAKAFCEQEPSLALDERLRPLPSEPIVPKSRYSPFYATDLGLMLRMSGVTHLLLAGLSTGGVVLSALRDAWDEGWRLTVLKDACADLDSHMHALLTERLFTLQATVLTVDEWRLSLPS